jgi:uncharacterized iron-regulated membrane protein
MRISFDKIKKADRHLMIALIFCLFMGFAFLAFVLRTYLKHELLTDPNLGKPVSADLYQSLFVVTQILVYWVLTCAAVGYFVVGYAIWNYRRKRGAIKDHDKPDA